MRIILTAFAFLWLLTARAVAPVEVTVTIETNHPGAVIPADFVGISFGTKTMLAGKEGRHFFSPDNKPLVELFTNIGLRHLRIGGTTVESPVSVRIPNEADIDSLFAFARASGVRSVIYSFRLLETGTNLNYAETNAVLARHIWDHYRDMLDCFAIGNEPDRGSIYKKDITIKGFRSYLKKWRDFARAISNAVPEAKFTGPDAGSANVSWTTNFARGQKDNVAVKFVAAHYYAGDAGRGVPAPRAIDDMLSSQWVTNYAELQAKMMDPVSHFGFPLRFTEANDHFSGGVPGASDTFAGALWALDFLHWWALHDARGVDFHNTQWVVSDILAPDDNGDLRMKPKASGLRAFQEGANGAVLPVKISNPENLNLTAYAVLGSNTVTVTIINKEHGADARGAHVAIELPGTSKVTQILRLSSRENNVTSKSEPEFGPSPTSLESDIKGRLLVFAGPSSAIICRFSR